MKRPMPTNLDSIRACMAAQFAFVQYAVSNGYGRPTYLDLRVQRARRWYLAAVRAEQQLEIQLRQAA